MLDLSLLAILIGGAIFLTRAPGVFFPKETAKVFRKFLKMDESFLRSWGVVLFMLSVVILYNCRKFVWDWELAMTIMGILTFIISLVFLYAPATITRLGKRVFDSSEALLWFMFLCGSVVGAFYLYLGLYVY